MNAEVLCGITFCSEATLTWTPALACRPTHTDTRPGIIMSGVVRRAAFDIGSGASKMLVADVDTLEATAEPDPSGITILTSTAWLPESLRRRLVATVRRTTQLGS